MKGRCLLNPQPDTRGISKMVIYAIGNSFRPSRNVVGQLFYSCQKGPINQSIVILDGTAPIACAPPNELCRLS